MAIELEKLIEKVKNTDISLVAGENGIHAAVNWVHIVETTEASTFMEGGEVIITTGLGVNGNEKAFLDLVKLVHDNNAAGMIVNIGPFISEIPDEVINYCNKSSFPLYIVPWRVHLAEITRIFSLALSRDEQKKYETASAFKNAILFPNQPELYLVPLSQRGFHSSWRYCVFVTQLDGGSAHFNIDSFIISLDLFIQHHYKNVIVFNRDTEIITVIANKTEAEIRSILSEYIQHIKKELPSDLHPFFGAGKLTKSIRCLYKSSNQARSICQLQRTGNIAGNLYFYPDLGLYRILMGIEDKDIISDFYSNTLKPIISYDKKKDSDLTCVLKTYLKNNGSVKDTASELFVHRNTINYKLKKIEELTNMDLSNVNDRLQLLLALNLKEILYENHS